MKEKKNAGVGSPGVGGKRDHVKKGHVEPSHSGINSLVLSTGHMALATTIKCPFCNTYFTILKQDSEAIHVCEKVHDYRGKRVRFGIKATIIDGGNE